MRRVTILFFAVAICSSCNLFQNENEQEWVAKVGEDVLLLVDIEDVTKDKSKEDSLEVASSYVNSWIKEQLLLQKALQNLSEEQVDFERQLKDYKNSLVIYAYENLIVNQKLDTLVSTREIEEYYNANVQNFKLKEKLFQLRFIKAVSSAPNQDSVQFWLNEEDFDLSKVALNEYCSQFATLCFLDTLNWVKESLIIDILPKSDVGIKSLNNKKVQLLKDSTDILFIDVIDWREKGEDAPISFVKDRIIGIIRNRRRIKLLSNLKEEIFEEATLKRQYEIFE